MNEVSHSVATPVQRLSVPELRKLPLQESNAILVVQAALAEAIYRNDPQMTDFEAFGENDLHGESSSANPR